MFDLTLPDEEEYGGLADSVSAPKPARLSHMESGEWRYGQADPSRPGDAAADADSAARASAGANRGGEPDLWAEESTSGWLAKPSWPATSTPPEAPRAADSMTPAPVWGDSRGWNQVPAPHTPPDGRRQDTVPTPWGSRSTEPLRPPAPALPVLPKPGNPGGQPAPHAAPPPFERVPPGSSVRRTDENPYRRTGFDSWSRPEPARRARVSTEDEFGPRRRDPYGEEPAYGPVLGYTAGWYGIPGILYLVWLVTLDSDRQGFVGRQLVTSLPWLFAAVVLSLAVAGLLRWAIIGWRALTLSFAAAVIGAGLTTIAHSLTL